VVAGGFYPIAIAASVCGAVALLFYSLGGNVGGLATTFGKSFKSRIDKADMQVKPQDFALILIGVSALLWGAALVLFHTSVLISLIALPLCIALVTFAGIFYLTFTGNRRVATFTQQLELALRMLAGALRVGLGLRQAIILVTEEVPDPARREFMRVIGRTNIGISILDAFDELSDSMPSHEMRMFARTVRVQSQTGGDLAKVLESLAGTIRDRRRVTRKMLALTAQGRFGAIIVGGLPLLVGGFVISTQPDLGQALTGTKIGWAALGIVGVLEFMACYTLYKILQFDA